MQPVMAEPVLARIGQIAIPVQDLDRAVQFYRDVLGLRFLFQVPNLAFFDCGGIRLMLDLPAAGQSASIIYYKVTNIGSAFESLTARGAVAIEKPHLIARMPDHELWMAFFHDSEQNTFAIMSEVPLAG